MERVPQEGDIGSGKKAPTQGCDWLVSMTLPAGREMKPIRLKAGGGC